MASSERRGGNVRNPRVGEYDVARLPLKITHSVRPSITYRVAIYQVSPATSARRDKLIELTDRYQATHPGVMCATSSARVDARQWQHLVLDSKFTISPAGRNPETFRTWEALEAG